MQSPNGMDNSSTITNQNTQIKTPVPNEENNNNSNNRNNNNNNNDNTIPMTTCLSVSMKVQQSTSSNSFANILPNITTYRNNLIQMLLNPQGWAAQSNINIAYMHVQLIQYCVCACTRVCVRACV